MIQTDLSDVSYDGYIISPLQQDMVANLIQDTEKPVIALDTNIESDKVVTFVGTGNEEAANRERLPLSRQPRKLAGLKSSVSRLQVCRVTAPILPA